MTPKAHNTISGLFQYKLNPHDPWPDIIDFFSLLGYSVSLIDDFNLNLLSPQPHLDAVFESLNQAIMQKHTVHDFITNKLQKDILASDIIHVKDVYNNFLDNKNWHTPIAALFVTNQYYLTKGYKKTQAAIMLGVEKLPLIVVHKENIEGSILIKTDKEFIEILSKLAGDTKVVDPAIGIKFYKVFKNAPGFHWIDINKEVAVRPDWRKILDKDLDYWSKNKKIAVNYLPKTRSGIFQLNLIKNFNGAREEIETYWQQGFSAIVIGDSSEQVERLVYIMPWFGSDSLGNPVGTASYLGAEKIYFNRSSNLNIEIAKNLL